MPTLLTSLAGRMRASSAWALFAGSTPARPPVRSTRSASASAVPGQQGGTAHRPRSPRPRSRRPAGGRPSARTAAAPRSAHELGARVIGTGRAADREAALGLGADAFVDLQADRLEEAGEVDVVFDVIGGEVLERLAPLVRAGGTLVTIAGPATARPADGRAIFFVVEPDRFRLAELAERVRSGRLNPIIGAAGRSLRCRPCSPLTAGCPARRSSGSPKGDNGRRETDQPAGRSGRPVRSRRTRPRSGGGQDRSRAVATLPQR